MFDLKIIGSVRSRRSTNRAVKWHLVIALVLICLLVSSAALGGVVLAGEGGGGNKKPKKVKVAVNGDIDGGVANLVLIKLLGDGFKVFDRTEEMLGIIKAEAELMEVHGSNEAAERARETLQELKETFFADLWINFNEDETTGVTIVTIRSGSNIMTFAFPTPDPSDDEAEAALANTVFALAILVLSMPK
jgi:hypothetical protein